MHVHNSYVGGHKVKDIKEYDVLIVVTPSDYLRLSNQYERIIDLLPARKLIFIGNSGVGDYVRNSGLGERVGYINEDEIVKFEDVHAAMKKAIGSLISIELPRGITGWYYQQFLKLSYSKICQDDYYMVWDGDTIPTKNFSMFKDGTSTPYFDMKTEYHKPYFDTVEKLFPGMHKSLGKSFISEHMLFKKSIVEAMVTDIMNNEALAGDTYYERIINAIAPKDLMETSFSEFETYGTYVSFKYPMDYALREWHSIRYGSIYFEMNSLSQEDYEWIGKDFYAVSFEKNQEFNPDIALIFKTPEYRNRLTARQIIEAIQDSSSEGMREEWDDENIDSSAVNLQNSDIDDEIVEQDVSINDEYLLFNYLGDSLLQENINQAYLCYENAYFLCPDANIKAVLKNKKEELMATGKITVNKTAIVIVSYNACYLMQQCLNSIRKYCAPDAYEIVVVDNASTDSVRDYLKRQNDITLVMSDENLGFPKGCNVGIANADAKSDIFLLNNDTRMTHNALFWLRMGLYENDHIGGTGSLANYCGIDQREDVTFALPDQYVEYGLKMNVLKKQPYEEKNKLGGFAMLLKREAFDKIGSLEEKFSPGYFEDDDISTGIHVLGYKLLVCHNSFIYHAGSQSFIKRNDLQEIFDRNHRFMTEKWGYDTLTYSVVTEKEAAITEEITHSQNEYFKILEIGAGSGNMISRLKYLYPQSVVYGIEDNETVVKNGVESIPLLYLDWKSDRLPFAQGFFDYIVIFDRRGEGIDELLVDNRVKPFLKSDGKIIKVEA